VEDAGCRRYDFAAFPGQAGNHAPHVSVGVSGTVNAVVWLSDPAGARELAALLDALALATPQQHRELASQVRRAAAMLDGDDSDDSDDSDGGTR
jgi:hypothetical protein